MIHLMSLREVITDERADKMSLAEFLTKAGRMQRNLQARALLEHPAGTARSSRSSFWREDVLHGLVIEVEVVVDDGQVD